MLDLLSPILQILNLLTTIGVNSALMIVRKRRVRRETYPNANFPDAETFELQNLVDRSLVPEGNYLKKQTVLLVRRAAKKLHPSLRSVVRYYYETECSVEEAAKVQEISVAAAKSRLSRGRARLRSSLERRGISNPRVCVIRRLLGHLAPLRIRNGDAYHPESSASRPQNGTVFLAHAAGESRRAGCHAQRFELLEKVEVEWNTSITESGLRLTDLNPA